MDEIVGKLPSKGDFAAQIDTVFRIEGDHGDPFEATLVTLEDVFANEQYEVWVLTFLAPLDAPPKQGIYRLQHGELGSMELFIVPVQRDDKGIYFEAVFNLLAERPIEAAAS